MALNWARRRLTAVAAAALLVVAAFGSSRAQGASNAPVQGGIFRAAMSASPPTLDVMTTVAATTRMVTWAFLESLVTYGEDYKIEPLLAERWDVSPDGKKYTFYLRRGVKFHNGKEMTAEDVVASAQRFLQVTPRKAQFPIAQVQAKDRDTVVFTLSKPYGAFLAAMASPVGYMAIMPKEIITGKGAEDLTKVQDMVGTGPYQLVEWKPDQVIRLKKFAEYKPLPGRRSGLGGNKTPYFDELQYVVVTEPGARVAGLQTGEYDYAEDIPPARYDDLKNDPNIRLMVIKPLRWLTIDFNFGGRWGSNLNFRRAVQAALDMEGIMNAVTGGRREFYRLQPSIYFNESEWWTDVGRELYNQRNVAKAKEYLKAAGYHGEVIILLTNRDYDYMYKTILTAAEQLRKDVGMNVKVEVRDWAGQRAMWAQNTGWDLDTTAFLSQALFDPGDFANVWSCAAKRKFYCNPQLDRLFEAGASTADKATRKRVYAAIQKLYYEDVISVKVGDQFGLEAVRNNIQNFKPWYMPRLWNVWRSR